MGQSNAAVRQWMGNPKRFADLFNATVFNGEQVIRPKELEPVDGEGRYPADRQKWENTGST